MIAGALKVLGGVSIGVAIGQQWARAELDKYYRAKGEEFVSSQYRAMQAAFTERKYIEPEAPVATEEELDGPDTSDDAIVVGGEAILIQGNNDTPVVYGDMFPTDYVGQAAVYATPDMLSGVSYITEDDYLEEDGNAKEQIVVHFTSDEPLFEHDGSYLDGEDWKKFIGETIIDDFYRLIPPTETNRVLYVRNHTMGVDYEVSQVIP